MTTVIRLSEQDVIVLEGAPGTGGASFTSSLKSNDPDDDEYNAAIDGLEALVLALHCAGFDVTTPQFVEAVTTAHLNGATWNDIATLIGTSTDEAQLRFDPGSPIADPRWPWPTGPQ